MKTYSVDEFKTIYSNGHYCSDGTFESYYFEDKNEAIEKYNDLKRDLIFDYQNGDREFEGIGITSFEDDEQTNELDESFCYDDFESEYYGGYEWLDKYETMSKVEKIIEEVMDDYEIEERFYKDYPYEVMKLIVQIVESREKGYHDDWFDEIESIFKNMAERFVEDEKANETAEIIEDDE